LVTLTVIDVTQIGLYRQMNPIVHIDFQENELPQELTNSVLIGDCIEKLRTIPDNSIDFAFVDPPYNLKKKYSGYSDDLDIQEYFKWCDEWIFELSRVLKPGRTLALLNIPLWSVRHFLCMQTILKYQNWLVWDVEISKLACLGRFSLSCAFNNASTLYNSLFYQRWIKGTSLLYG